MNIGFWNLNNKDLIAEVKGLAFEKSLDLIVLAENFRHPINSKDLSDPNFQYVRLKLNSRLKIFSLVSKNTQLRILDESPYYSIIGITQCNTSFLLVVLHLPSKLWATDDDRSIPITAILEALKLHEKNFYNRTIVLGDFNLNPFSKPMIHAGLLNTTNCKKTVSNLKRKVAGTQCSYFYNPMWKFFSKDFDGFGTYYFHGSGAVIFKWNVFDQVILRPEMLKFFDEPSLEVVTTINGIDLVLKNKNIRKSDHFPITFSLIVS
ncbi:hypothetical protein ACJVC5_11320 [Peredibacter sp. HCB2-198]|uniref:hypothetical protein n=1 Tax=Peredibacter sp. HCB2-198 TaxID=3383025 RepID=UPI0038B66E8A